MINKRLKKGLYKLCNSFEFNEEYKKLDNYQKTKLNEQIEIDNTRLLKAKDSPKYNEILDTILDRCNKYILNGYTEKLEAVKVYKLLIELSQFNPNRSNKQTSKIN